MSTTQRKRSWMVLLLVFSLGLYPNVLTAEIDHGETLQQAVEFCLAPPADTNAARAIFVDRGWQEGDVERIMQLLSAAVFALRLDLDDLSDSYSDAVFLAASMLGNSALGPNQLSFTSGTLEIVAMGLDEGVPQCAITGPSSLIAPAIGNGVSTISMGGQSIGLSVLGDHILASAFLSPTPLLERLDQFPLEERDSFRRFVETVLPEALIYIGDRSSN